MATQKYATTSPLPISQSKKPSYAVQPPLYPQGLVLGSPPEAPESVSTSSGALFDHLSSTSTTHRLSGNTSYAASTSTTTAPDYENTSSGGAVGAVDLLEYMNDRLTAVIDTTPLDKSLVTQVQTSAMLNAKSRELAELQALAQRRLAATKTNLVDGLKAAKDVQRDLDWMQKRVNSMNQRVEAKYPAEYQTATEMYPAPVDC